MKWIHSSRFFCLVVAVLLFSWPLYSESSVNWDSVMARLAEVRKINPELAQALAVDLLAMQQSYDQVILDKDKQILDQSIVLTKYDKAYQKANNDLKISYAVEGGLGGLTLAALLWATIEHFSK